LNTHYTYLLVDFFCFIFPFLFSFHPLFKFYKTWRAFIPASLLTAVFFIVWDSLFTHLGVWWFNPNYTLPHRFFGLPLEEILFFMCIPYACTFTYFCVKLYVKLPAIHKSVRLVFMIIIAFLLLIGLFNLQKLYTSVTFILLSLTLTFLLVKKVDFLTNFLLSFILILPFFFLSNGVLTGSFIQEPVVSYNSLHNLGIRLFTIPFEDTFYGMLLLVLNVGLYEWFGQRSKLISRHPKSIF
jgi:lycopene cyclase domain-containing protein